MGGQGSGRKDRDAYVQRHITLGVGTDAYLSKMTNASGYVQALIEQHRADLRAALRRFEHLSGPELRAAIDARAPERMGEQKALHILARELELGNSVLEGMLQSPGPDSASDSTPSEP